MSTRGKKGWILAFSLPCLVLFCLVYAIPFVMVITTSFCDYSLTQSPVFEGLKNFKTIFADPDFSVSIVNTLKWVLIQSTLHVGFGFVMALILRRKPKGWKFARVAYVIPNIVPTAATAVMFSLLLNPSFGVIKIIYDKFGLDTTQDGATGWQKIVYITIPLMKNAFGTCVVLASVAMVSQFDIIYMTTKGGPGNATLNLPTYLYKIITLENNYGKANAVGVIQIALGLVLVILIQKLFNQKQEMKEV